MDTYDYQRNMKAINNYLMIQITVTLPMITAPKTGISFKCNRKILIVGRKPIDYLYGYNGPFINIM